MRCHPAVAVKRKSQSELRQSKPEQSQEVQRKECLHVALMDSR